MTKEELARMFEVIERDLNRWSLDDPAIRALSVFCMSAVWHLKGQRSFVERNDKMKVRTDKQII